MERLDKAIADQSTASRSDIKKLIRAGAVSVNGKLCKAPDIKIDPEKDEIQVNGKPLQYKKFCCIMLNKPKGVLSASRDKSAKTVIDLLPPELRRKGLFPAGRLDKDTTGLLLITDDGGLAHNMLAPKKHVEKEYRVQTRSKITEQTVRAFAEGIVLSDGEKCKSARLYQKEGEPETTCYVCITEGKYHQIKRMFAACENEVCELERIRIGKLTLDGSLPRGTAKELNSCEISLIFE